MRKKISWITLWVTLLGMMLAACSTGESLDATSWGMTSYKDSQGNLIDILPDTIVTADFQADQVSGIASCNNYSGTYQTNGNKITIGPLAATARMCEGVTGLMEQEAAFLSAMEAADRYEINGDTLEMMDDQGETILIFSRSTGE